MLSYDKKKELRDEELREIAEEPMREWINDNISTLEEEFIKLQPPEDRPLDSETPDWLDTYCDEFNEYAEKVYHEEVSE